MAGFGNPRIIIGHTTARAYLQTGMGHRTEPKEPVRDTESGDLL